MMCILMMNLWQTQKEFGLILVRDTTLAGKLEKVLPTLLVHDTCAHLPHRHAHRTGPMIIPCRNHCLLVHLHTRLGLPTLAALVVPWIICISALQQPVAQQLDLSPCLSFLDPILHAELDFTAPCRYYLAGTPEPAAATLN